MGKVKQELIDDGWINDRTYPTYDTDTSCKTKNHINAYNVWRSMKRRCTDKRLHEKYPTYAQCTASDEFKNYTLFHEWYVKQIGANLHNTVLDKDLKIKGNKIYSADTCLIIPNFLNSFLLKSDATRGNCLVGVYVQGTYKDGANRYQSRINAYSPETGKTERVHLGYFRSELDAFHAYKEAKEAIAKQHAAYLIGKVDEKAIQALLDFQVNIDD